MNKYHSISVALIYHAVQSKTFDCRLCALLRRINLIADDVMLYATKAHVMRVEVYIYCIYHTRYDAAYDAFSGQWVGKCYRSLIFWVK